MGERDEKDASTYSEFDIKILKALDPTSPMPLYAQLAQRFTLAIRAGELTSGALLPSESLCETYFKVSRPTIRQAMQKLTAERLIVRSRGRGTFVAPAVVDHHIAFSFEEEMRASHLPIEIRLLSWEKVKAPLSVSSALGTREKESVYQLQRMRIINGKPLGREIRYLPEHLGEKLTIDEVRVDPVFKLLRKVTSREVNRISYAVSAVAASARDAQLLQVKRGIPLLAREHTFFCSDVEALLHGTVLFVGDRYKFHFESTSGQIPIGANDRAPSRALGEQIPMTEHE